MKTFFKLKRTKTVGITISTILLTTFILYSQRLFEPLRQLAERFTQIQGGLTAVERIGELLEEEVEIVDYGAKNVLHDIDDNFSKSLKKLLINIYCISYLFFFST